VKKITFIPAALAILQHPGIRITGIFAIVLVLSLSLYRQSLTQLAASVIDRQDSSHGLLVPFISAFILWQRRDTIKKEPPSFAVLPGSLLVLCSAAMLLAPENSFYTKLSAISFFIMMTGLTLTFLGKKIFKEVCLPFLFLMTMIPLPETLYMCIAEWMRAITTENAVFVSQLFGIPFKRSNYYLQFPDILLHVSESCSGIRYLISYFVFGLAYAFFYKKSAASRILVLASIVPIAIVAGIMRLTVIFLAVHYIGAWTTDRIPHNLLSWSVFCAVLAAALLLDWKISSCWQRRVPAAGDAKGGKGGACVDGMSDSRASRARSFT